MSRKMGRNMNDLRWPVADGVRSAAGRILTGESSILTSDSRILTANSSTLTSDSRIL